MTYRILIIEADREIARSYIDALGQLGLLVQFAFEAQAVASFAAGQLQATRHKFDLVVATVRQDNEGIMLLQNLAVLQRGLKALLILAPGVAAIQARLATHLGARVLQAPFVAGELAAAVLSMLGLAATPRKATAPLHAEPRAARQQAASFAPDRAQFAQLQARVAQLGAVDGVRCALLADLSGQEIAAWAAATPPDLASLAALAAADLLATFEVSALLGGDRSCNLITQEYDDQTIVLAQVGSALVVTEPELPLGRLRLALKRTTAQILEVVTAATASAPPVLDERFAGAFAMELGLFPWSGTSVTEIKP
jgi:predicted regulator of Ras-like GTPase activity (Roadblock/LC7/MglB family)